MKEVFSLFSCCFIALLMAIDIWLCWMY